MLSGKKAELLRYLKNDESQIVDCSNHGLKGSDLPDLISILQNKPKVTDLNISFLGIGITNIELLKILILKIKGLQILNLRENDLGNDGLLNLINDPKLINIINKIDFNFSNNDINDEGLAMILKISEEKDLPLSPNSLLSILYGNPIYDKILITNCRALIEALRTKEKSSISDENKDVSDDAKDNVNKAGSSLPANYFFSKTASPRTSDTCSKPPSSPSSGATSKSSTPPSEECVKQHTRKLSKSGDATD